MFGYAPYHGVIYFVYPNIIYLHNASDPFVIYALRRDKVFAIVLVMLLLLIWCMPARGRGSGEEATLFGRLSREIGFENPLILMFSFFSLFIWGRCARIPVCG